jgi:hypothetical protein
MKKASQAITISIVITPSRPLVGCESFACSREGEEGEGNNKFISIAFNYLCSLPAVFGSSLGEHFSLPPICEAEEEKHRMSECVVVGADLCSL